MGGKQSLPVNKWMDIFLTEPSWDRSSPVTSNKEIYGEIIGPATKPNDIFGLAISRSDLFGAKLAAFMVEAVGGLASMVAMIGQLPDPANRVTLGSGRDRLGLPVAKVVHNVDDATMGLWRHCAAEGKSVMTAAGAGSHNSTRSYPVIRRQRS